MTTTPPRPTQAIELANTSDGFEVQYPLTISQCEPMLMYYNTTLETYSALYAPDGIRLITFYLPSGTFYMEWVCNIPAGYGLYLEYDLHRFYRVQSGPSSCLRNVTTTYPFATYTASVFQSYTAFPPNTAVPSLTSLATQTVTFPTAAHPTVTVNPDFLFAPASSTSPDSNARTPSTSRKLNTPAIAGGITGAVAVILLVFAIIFLVRRRRQRATPPSIVPFVSNPGQNLPSGLQISTEKSRSGVKNAQMLGITSPSSVPSTAISDQAASPVSALAISSYNRPKQRSRVPTSLDNALDAISRSRPMTNSTSPVDTMDSPSRRDSTAHIHQGIATTSSEQQDHVSRMINALHSISHLDNGERQALASVLAVQPLTGSSGSVEPLPPPYI